MKNIVNKIGTTLIILLCPFFSLVYGQEKNVEGIVLSDKGKFLENVKISVKENPSISIFTDVNGKFELPVENYQYLIVEYENTAKKVVKVSDIIQDKNIILDSGSKLVNVGYSKELRKEDIVSSVGYVDKERLDKVSTPDVGNSLFGQLQGLRVFQNSGYFPDERMPDLNIRGQATTRDGSILVLIDGVERPLETVLPEEIESVTVLRDAAAKARYGQRGANGVLLLTTKRGSKGAIKFTATVQQGVNQPTRLPEFLDAASYAKAENEARINDGLVPRYSDTEIAYFQSGQYPYLYPNVNWVDETLAKSGYFSNYNFNFTGGNDITNYFVNFNYQNEDGLYKNTNLNDDYSTQLSYNKVNLRANLDIKVTPTTLAQVNMGGFVTIKNQPATPGAGQREATYVMFNTQQYDYKRNNSRDIVSDAFSIPSALFPVRNEDGSWGGTNQFGNNPIAEISDVGFDKNHIRSFFNEIRVKQNLDFILQGLSAEVFGAYYNQADYWENKTKTYAYTEVTPVLDAFGSIVDINERQLGQKTDLQAVRYSGDMQRTSYDFRGELSYDKIFDEHVVNAWVLVQQNQYDMHATNQVYRYRNFSGNVHYGFNNRYLIDATLSYSGTNRIQNRSDRYGLFPAIAGAWIISNESFMKDVDFVDFLKFRTSYGKAGNGLIDIKDLTSDKFGGGNSYNFGNSHTGEGGTREIEIGINQKKFETSLESNFGIEAKLFEKLDVTGEVFFVNRKNIFVQSTGKYSTVLGLLPLMVPEGEVSNKGYELEATWSDEIGNFNYYINGMFSKYKNKIINMNEDYRPYDYMKRTGKSIGQYFGWETQGFFNDEAAIANHPTQMFGNIKPGDIIYSDKNNDNVVDEYDQVAIGYSNFPEIYYSFSLGLGWKGFELSALFQGTDRASAYLSQSHVFWPLRGDDNISTWYKNYWSQTNREKAELPRLTKQSDNNYRTNDIWVQDKSFLKLRYAEFSYSLPKNFLGNYGIQQMKFYLRGRDLFCFDNIKYVDPENVGYSYPTLKSYNIGVIVKF